jgi:spermidine/putrescine transport system substrate-binding protein
LNKSVLLVVMVLFSFVSCGRDKKETLYLFNWTYFIPDQVLFDFEKEFGVRVELDTYDGNDTMYAKLRSGNAPYDVVVPSGDFVAMMAQQGMLRELDKELLPNLKHIDQSILDYMNFDPGQRYSVPYAIGATGINVNIRQVPDADASWTMFDRTDLASRMTLMNDTRDVLAGALKTLGYSANSMSLEEINAARDLVLSWKPNILKFDAESFGKDFASGNTWVAQGFPEVVMKELESASAFADYRFLVPREGGLIYLDNMVVLANAPNPELAHTFINYILRPDVHAKIMDEFWYPSLMEKAEPMRKVEAPYTIAQLFENNYELRADVGEALRYYTAAWDMIMAH